MATEDSGGTAAQTSVRTTNAGTGKAFIVALLLRVILAGLIHLESLQGTEPPRTAIWRNCRFCTEELLPDSPRSSKCIVCGIATRAVYQLRRLSWSSPRAEPTKHWGGNRGYPWVHG